MYIDTLAELDEHLDRWIARFEQIKKQFIDSLDKNPVNALQWGEDMHEHAARFDLATHYKSQIADRANDIEKGEEVVPETTALHNIRVYALRRALDGAVHGGNSSGVLHNLARRYETKAYAELAAMFDHLDRQVVLGYAG